MKATKEIKAKLERISVELEDELVREKIVIDECEGVELNALDEGGVSLLFQEPENMDAVEDVENYEELNISLSIYFASWLPESKRDLLEKKLRDKMEENRFLFSPVTGDGNGVYIYGAEIEGVGGKELRTLHQFLDFLKTTHRLNSKTAAVNRAAEVIGVTRVTVWRWLDSDRGPGAPMDLLMKLIMERGTTKNLPS